MEKDNFDEQVATTLKEIHQLLTRSVEIQQQDTEIDSAIHDLEKTRTETTSGLLEHAALTNTLAGQRTEMSRERTSLVREQTRLSTKSTELSAIRTDMSRERTGLAGQRTDLSVLRTDFSRTRTSLAGQRNKMAADRTQYSIKRTTLAGTRTVFSNIRTALAQGRTYLALIRTGLAFLSLSIAFFRIFGISWWSIFDGILALLSLIMTGVGIVGYRRATREVSTLQLRISTGEPVG